MLRIAGKLILIPQTHTVAVQTKLSPIKLLGEGKKNGEEEK